MRFSTAWAAIALALLCCPAAAGARDRAPAALHGESAAAPRTPARASRRQPRIVYLPSPSEESAAQRERRLARECRGLPNAGACLGHALARPRTASRRR